MLKCPITRIGVAGFTAFLTLLPWSCTDHQPIPDCDELLTGCSAGWKPTRLKAWFVDSKPAPDCYRMIFRKDGTVVIDRTRCAGQDTTLIRLGTWSCSPTSLALPYRPFNTFSIPEPVRIEELSAGTLRFSWRTGVDTIEETWSCE